MCDAVGETLIEALCDLSRAAWRVADRMLVDGLAMDLAGGLGSAHALVGHSQELCGAAVKLWDWVEALSVETGGPDWLAPEPWARGENSKASPGGAPTPPGGFHSR